MKTAGVVLAVALGLVMPIVASAEEGLFVARPTAADHDAAPELGVVRARAVAIDFRGLPGADGVSALPRAGHALQLNLFDDVVLAGRMTRAQRLDRGLSWSGRLVDDPFSSVEIVVYDGVMSGSVNGKAGSYRIGWDGTGHVVEEMDYDQFPEEHDCALDHPYTPMEAETDLEAQTALDDGSFIDVMVVYTPAARAAQGGTSAMQSLINLAISETNTAYANSGVSQRVRLVHTEEVAYTESGGISTDLCRVTLPQGGSNSQCAVDAAGYMENVLNLRNTHSADLVSLFVTGYNAPGGACGVAWLMSGNSPGFAPNAFSVVDRECATGYYSFGHEMGHNQGLNHAHGDPVGTGAYTYSFGHKWPGYRSVMAYSPGTRVQQFSNPNVNHSGHPTGVSDYEDNARSLNNTRVTVANWRVAAVPTVALTSPNGGQSWRVGSIQPITWTSSALDAGATIRLSYTNGSTTTTIATDIDRTSHSYNWTVPSTLGSSWKVAVCSWVGGACEADDMSDANFAITSAATPPARRDFDGDAKGDLLWHNQGGGDLYVWFMNGMSRTGGSYLSPDRFSNTQWQIRGIADLNRDGKNDILWHNQATGYLYVWLMNGLTQIGGSYLTPDNIADTNWQIRAVEDLNGDGNPDILWHNQVMGDLYVWYLDGFTRVSGGYPTPNKISNTAWKIRGLADFDNDGKKDILWHNQAGGDLYVWFMNGLVQTGGSYLTPSTFSNTAWQIRDVADYNGDGKKDILWRNQATGYLYVWFMNGLVQSGGSYLSPSQVSNTSWKVSPQ